MGQQQLLLLVIGVIVVGLAVVAGLQASETKFRQSVADNLVERNLTIATDAVFWKTKRDPYNGGNASYAGLAVDGMQKLFLGETTHMGLFKITMATETELEIRAEGIRYPEICVRTSVLNYEIVSTDIAYDAFDGCIDAE